MGVVFMGRGEELGRTFFLDLLSLRDLWDIKVEVGYRISLEVETSN